eukprot:COSAG01_NODE_31494_length_596_cov_1.545272_1_plen_121_part_10
MVSRVSELAACGVRSRPAPQPPEARHLSADRTDDSRDSQPLVTIITINPIADRGYWSHAPRRTAACSQGRGHRRDPPTAVRWHPPHRCFPARYDGGGVRLSHEAGGPRIAYCRPSWVAQEM